MPAVRRSLSSQSWVAAWTRTCSYLPLRATTKGCVTSGRGGGRLDGRSRTSHPSVSHWSTLPAGRPNTVLVSAALHALSTQAKIAGNVSLPSWSRNSHLSSPPIVTMSRGAPDPWTFHWSRCQPCRVAGRLKISLELRWAKRPITERPQPFAIIFASWGVLPLRSCWVARHHSAQYARLLASE